MKTNKTLLVVVFCVTTMLLLSACAKDSYYVNRSTEGQNVITATGKAAENAAWTNTSHRGGGAGSGGRGGQSGYQEPSVGEKIIKNTQTSFASQVNYAIRRAMEQAFNRY